MKLLGYDTQQGAALSVSLHAGHTLQYTRAVAGDGVTPLSAAAMTAECQTLHLGTPRRIGDTVTLPATLAEALAPKDYTLTEVGVYALNQRGEEILYRIFRLSEPMDIVAEGTLSVCFDLQETLSSETAVSVVGSPAGLVTEDFIGASGGVAGLDGEGRVPLAQLPITCGTVDLVAGATPLADGHIHFVYEE